MNASAVPVNTFPASPGTGSTAMSCRTFGRLPGGETVHAWTLGNAAGASLQVITYGAIVTHLRMPDRHGRLADVVLGFDSLTPYLTGHPYFGAVIGRVAGRMTNACFTLDGRTHQLARNSPPNHLHGGAVGFDKKLWSAKPMIREDGASSVRLRLQSADGDQGYPGELDVAVTFTLTDENEFIFETEAVADRPTPVSLTHHSYFNLAGEDAGPVTGHEVQIHACDYAPAGESMTLLGRRESVAGRDCDFRRSRRLGDALPGLPGQHGDLYFIDRPSGEPAAMRPAARVTEHGSGRVLEVRTTEDCLQLYTAVALNSTLRGKSGAAYGPHQGLCLECEGYPDGANIPALGDIVVYPGQPRRHATGYAFSVC